MTKYKYTGAVPRIFVGVGKVYPGQEFETDKKINHPHVSKKRKSQKKEAEVKESHG